eukprot:CAMPEP_0201719106 /NCGR_PEP_ID=MMETSP0593-20130828/4408_1 /ASSEMBLY_ACC=CAM_ASM_000672 /TAXON_ID=267983 /ORGANISM="Skeletonema japonicum, Strain CCMP2506" /LENGTH=716 /DNA_ID=CAMNT_0048209497 /DNA_START=401 /DNA_END=2551 /DNA_ORIENTATION=+
MSGESFPAKDSNDGEASKEVTPIKNNDDTKKEGASEINISPGNDASPNFNNQDQGSPNSSDWPLTGIIEPGPNDCLFGRGGGTNHHAGNKLYRKMVEEKKDLYLSSKRLDKPLVAMEIINQWRSMDPPGRFLKQDDRTKLWSDVGDRKAREKTSQALREKAPSDTPPASASARGSQKETRFEPGTLSPGGGRMRPSLAREHSLGTEEPMGPNEMSLEGFSWDESDQPVVDKQGANLRNPHHPPEAASYSPYHVRHNSLATNPLPEASTANAAPPFGDPYYHHYHPHYSSPPHHHYPPPPPPPPHYQSPQGHHQYHPSTPSSAGRQREHSLQMNPLKGGNTSQPAHDTFTDPNYEGQAPPPYPPHHPSYYYPPGPPHHWAQPPPPPPSQYYPGSQPSAFTQYEAVRSPTNSSEYDDRRASGASSSHSVEAEPAGTSQDFTRLASLIRDTSEGSTLARSSSADESGRGSSDHGIKQSYSMPLQGEGAFPSPPKNASERKQIGGDSPASKHVRKPSLLKKLSGGTLQNTTPVAAPNGALRPEPVKRDTSNQPESLETKRSTKRVILSRDKSAIAKSLKEAQRQQEEAAMLSPKLGLSKTQLDRNLSVEMHKLGLGGSDNETDKPDLNSDINMPQMVDRMTTTDVLGEIFDDSELASGVDELDQAMFNGGSRLQSVEWDSTLNLLVEGSNESEPDSGAVNEDVAARWISSGTSAHNGTEF